MHQAIKIGCCGFPVARARYFASFDVVELQQTFYEPPGNPLAEKWRCVSPDSFEYTLKAWQLITHTPSSPTYRKLKIAVPHSKEASFGSFKPTDEVFAAWERTREIGRILRARVIVFQCPPSFGPTTEHRSNMRKFFSQIKREFIFAWEPRGTWSKDEAGRLCAELDLVHVVDPLNNLPQHGQIRYYRLHGMGGYRYRYTEKDLATLKTVMQASGDIYCLFNNVYMYENALSLQGLLRT